MENQFALSRFFRSRKINITILALWFLALASQPGWCSKGRKDDLVTEPHPFVRHYQISLGGTIFHEQFSGVNAILTFQSPPPESSNRYRIIIDGTPKSSANSCHMDSEDCSMSLALNEIKCSFKSSQKMRSTSYFFHLSPALFNKEIFPTREARQRAERITTHTKPTHILALAGEFAMTIHGNGVTGTLWMRGYDPVEHSHVVYQAHFQGTRSPDDRIP